MARDFDGTDDRIDWASVFTTSGQALTIAAWAWIDVLTPATASVLFCGSASGGNAGTLFLQTGGVNGRITFNRLGSTTKVRTTVDTVGIGSWNHWLVTDDGSLTAANAHIYFNGTEPSYATTTNGATETAANSTWALGGLPVAAGNNWNGRLAEVGVWNRVLTAGEIALLARAFAPSFITPGLRFYCPVGGRSTEINRFGAASTTTVGTTYLEHPRVIYPGSAQELVIAGAAAPAGQPTMRRWGGIPSMTPGGRKIGRSW